MSKGTSSFFGGLFKKKNQESTQKNDTPTAQVLNIVSPFSGQAIALSEVPDPVFAQGMVGHGLAIIPDEGICVAPCAGKITNIHTSMHAVTIKASEDFEILVHTGIDTVMLKGEGFKAKVSIGDIVNAGDVLLEFDLALIQEKAALPSPVLLMPGEGVVFNQQKGPIKRGDFLMNIGNAQEATSLGSKAIPAKSTNQSPAQTLEAIWLVPFHEGVHARPAAIISSKLRNFQSTIELDFGNGFINGKSTTALMATAAEYNSQVKVKVHGTDAQATLDALLQLQAPTETEKTHQSNLNALSNSFSDNTVLRPQMKGVIASRGLATGNAHLYIPADIEIPQHAASNTEENILKSSIRTVEQHINQLMVNSDGFQKDVYGAHLELLLDPEVLNNALAYIKQGKNASQAWHLACSETAQLFANSQDTRLSERQADIKDINLQVRKVLAGKDLAQDLNLPDNTIIVAEELLPSHLAQWDATKIQGIATAFGGATSHVAIIAAEQGIPALVGLGRAILGIKENTALIIDAQDGILHINPSSNLSESIRHKILENKAKRVEDRSNAAQSAFMIDGGRIHTYANLGSVEGASKALSLGAEGCGLFRTEFLFAEKTTAPTLEQQVNDYEAIAKTFGSMPLTIRTIDIGGDKPLPYIPALQEENPALGLRGIRIHQWQESLMKTQLSALLIASKSYSNIRIMLPMVNEPSEFRVFKALIQGLAKELKVNTIPPLGVMIETPAAALMSYPLAKEADFFSVGTNDLSQYTLAMDRTHPQLSKSLDAIHPAILRLIQVAADSARLNHCEIGVCGGLASDPLAVPLLIGLGIEELSIVPEMVPDIKAHIRGLKQADCTQLAQDAMQKESAQEVRDLVKAWLKK